MQNPRSPATGSADEKLSGPRGLLHVGRPAYGVREACPGWLVKPVKKQSVCALASHSLVPLDGRSYPNTVSGSRSKHMRQGRTQRTRKWFLLLGVVAAEGTIAFICRPFELALEQPSRPQRTMVTSAGDQVEQRNGCDFTGCTHAP